MTTEAKRLERQIVKEMAKTAKAQAEVFKAQAETAKTNAEARLLEVKAQWRPVLIFSLLALSAAAAAATMLFFELTGI